MLSAPIFRLKKEARLRSKEQNIPLHEALNQIAKVEGFESWSLLASAAQPSASTILPQLKSGELVLLAARPYQGKTTLSLCLLREAVRTKREASFFSLDLTEEDIRNRLVALGVDARQQADSILIDTSEDISGDYIISRLKNVKSGSLVVVDYLQLLDQNRNKPDLDKQVRSLKAFADQTRAIIVIISQINRRYEMTSKEIPSLMDVHLPNPVDLTAFSKACFINGDKIEVSSLV